MTDHLIVSVGELFGAGAIGCDEPDVEAVVEEDAGAIGEPGSGAVGAFFDGEGVVFLGGEVGFEVLGKVTLFPDFRSCDQIWPFRR